VHQIPPAQESSPEHVMWQVTPDPPQFTPLLHETAPEQTSTDNCALVAMPCGHEPSPLQVTEQSLPVQPGPQPQVFAPMQAICVLGAVLCTPRGHASLPEHWTEQLLPPQYTESAQELFPLQRMSQLVARVQSTKPAHEESPQVIWHGIWAGQVTPAAHAPGSLQSNTHAPPASR
jgi:hypothetical protein